MSVSIRDATAARGDRDWLAQAYQRYVEDLSFGNTGLFPALGAEGVDERDPVLEWLHDERSRLLVLQAGGRAAGFARVIRERGPQGEPQFRMADFYVEPAQRRRGVGRQAAALIFARFAGSWLVVEETRNQPAVRFWRAVIGAFTAGRYTERLAGPEVRHSFVSGAHAPR